jgi:predicted anti-sigma-YlaC factor YlaD
MNLSCKRASELLSEEQDRDLTFAEWSALQFHLAICSACRAVSAQFRLLRLALERIRGQSPIL